MKFNKKHSTVTTNLAGGQAYKESNKLEFVSIILTSFLKDKFYESENETQNRIIILSDMQGWIGDECPSKEFNVYKKIYQANPYIYSFDLSGYGTLQFPENNVFALAGFSEKCFDIMKLMEKDKNALINDINKIEL